MAQVFSSVVFNASDDPAKLRVTDNAESPGGRVVVNFDSSKHVGVDAPGRVENMEVIDVASRERLPLFCRLATSTFGVLYSVDYLDGGLEVNGVDRFEYRQMWRLQNRDVPREHFD